MNSKRTPAQKDCDASSLLGTEAEAKKNAIKEVKNSKQYERFQSRQGFDAPTKPRVQLTEKSKFDAKLDKKYNIIDVNNI